MGTGRPPERWEALVPELMVEDLGRSMAFWCGPMGFSPAYERPTLRFAYLQRPEGCQLMLCQRDGTWETGPLEPPFGRGVLLQAYVADVDAVHAAVLAAGLPPYVALTERWRDWGDRLGGQREFLVQDPDGHLVMVAQRIGERPFPL